MITAVDSSVLWSLLKGEPSAAGWLGLLQAAAREGPLVVCPVVFAELSPGVPQQAMLEEVLRQWDMSYDAISPAAAFLAGQTFLRYRQVGGPREHLVPDFLIAAHAQTQAGRLAAVDRGYLRRWFPGLSLLKPAADSSPFSP